MGGEISITNKTKVPLVISLWQISPLYYDNFVPSEGTFHRKTGMVHLSIRARLWNGENGYTDWDNVLPITAAALGGLTLVAGALAAGGVALGVLGLAALETPAWIATAVAAGAEVYTIGSSLMVVSGAYAASGIIEQVKKWATKGCIISHGWLISGHRRFEIRGGPDAVIVEGKVLVDANTVRPFELVELKD
ncbi:uncharacterized protein LOC129597126 [Paramacrobiotus metropolitanus]|uniref:uncharacterized protein LOC129597126 n=1 Tax=Paramacrobiotus metropolitanus TaxID=2943436 RepID=UPI002445FEDD|nr:uncharacterized protein LOC129597126 [Paramacrobiotus metropolitanus]